MGTLASELESIINAERASSRPAFNPPRHPPGTGESTPRFNAYGGEDRGQSGRWPEGASMAHHQAGRTLQNPSPSREQSYSFGEPRTARKTVRADQGVDRDREDILARGSASLSDGSEDHSVADRALALMERPLAKVIAVSLTALLLVQIFA